jgi:hypothetical protein
MKATLLMLALAAFCIQHAAAQDMGQTAITLAQRIADTGYGATITVGSLPAGWTSAVPTPSSATLLGTVSIPSNGYTTLYYQAPNFRATYAAYIAALQKNGFSALRVQAPLRGFAPPESAGIPASSEYCKGGYSVTVMGPREIPGDLRIAVAPPQLNMTQVCGAARPAPPQRVSPLPLFAPPPGTQFEPVGNSFSAELFSRVPEMANSSAIITNVTSLNGAFGSLQSQLLSAGWQVGNVIYQGDAASAELTFGAGADAWHGLLVLFPATKPHSLVAQVSASGGLLSPSKAASVQTFQMPQVAEPLRKSQEPNLIRLMHRLFSEYASGMPQTVYVGRAPPGINKVVPLPDRSPIGSVAVEGLDQPMVVNPGDTLYYELSEKELRAYYARLKSRGWWPYTMPESKGSGFYGPQEGGIISFCKAGSPAVMVQPRPDTNPNDVNINVSDACGSGVGQAAIAQFEDRFGPMPPIHPPHGVSMAPGEPGVIGGVSGAKFQGASSLAQLLDSFSSQFVAAGWKAGVGSVNAHVGSRTFTISAKGRPWQAVVTVYASAAEPHTYYSFIDLTNLP